MKKVNLSAHWIYLLVLASAVLLGGFVRLVDLGRWSLAVDEYYFCKSVLNTLAHGLPQFPCGGYYIRGVFQQYLTAPILALSSDPEWASRIVPVVFNLLGIPALYLLGKRLGGQVVATTSVVLFSFSLWEIEMARFARMYSPFQTLFIWQMYFLALVLQERKRFPYICMYLLAGVGIFVYEGAIFLIIAILFSFLKERRFPKLGEGLVFLILVFATLLPHIVDFRQLGTTVPPIVSTIKGHDISIPVHIPMVLLTSVIHSSGWLFASIIPLLFFFRVLFCIWGKDKDIFSAGAWTIVLFCTIVNQFALATGLFLMFYLTGHLALKGDTSRSPFRLIFTSIILNLLFWTGYMIVGAGYSPSKTLKVFLKFPDVFNTIFVPWFAAMPVTTSMLIVLICLGVVLTLFYEIDSSELFRDILAGLLGLAMAVGMLETTFREPRYTFFFYPILLLIACKVLMEIPGVFTHNQAFSKKLGFGLIFIFILFSEDFGIQHLANIGSPEINFRTTYSPARQSLYYPRQDYYSPAQYVNQNIEEGDLVISMMPVADFYLDRLDYRFESNSSGRFRIIRACGGEREIWSNAPLLSEEEDLFKIVDARETTVWILAYSALRPFRADEEQSIEDKYKNALVYVSMDKTINVYRLQRDPESFRFL